MLEKSYSKTSKLVLLFSLFVVIFSLIPVVFPALISETVTISDLEKIGIIPYEEDPYQIGLLAAPLILINVIVFTTYFLKNKLPLGISKLFKKLFSFEISKKISLIIIVILLVIYVLASAEELSTEETLEDYEHIKIRLSYWNITQVTNQVFEPHVKYFLLTTSMILFGNYKVIPFLASIALLITTYIITETITKNRFAGLVSMMLVLQSSLFLSFDTVISYTNFWILFYLLSLYSVIRIWVASPILFGLSIFCKTLTVGFSPMSVFFILNSDISKNKKIILIGILGILVISGSILFLGAHNIVEQFRWDEFWVGFTSFAFQMRFDAITVLFLMPLIFGLFVSSKNNKYANSISILIVGILLSAPLITGFTDQTNQPYRFMPIIIFFAVGVGMLFSIKRVQRNSI